GARIGIIDSGIDYKHPQLGGCFGAGCFISHGYDFVGDAYTGSNNARPDSDPMDECNGHGTHVAGTAIEARTGVGIRSLGAYRVLGCTGNTELPILAQAM
ncbi:peptidase S8/S53 domain-containing protein, partial [Thamnocephalis sphaerospora]